MEMINCEDVYCIFRGCVTDPILSKQYDCVYELLGEYLKSALSDFRVRKLFKTISLHNYALKEQYEDEDELIVLKEGNDILYTCVDTIEYEYSYPIDTEFDKMFLIKILSYGMLVAWDRPKVNSVLNTQMMYGGKEEKFSSQANHIKALNETIIGDTSTWYKMIKDRNTYYNSYLNGE